MRYARKMRREELSARGKHCVTYDTCDYKEKKMSHLLARAISVAALAVTLSLPATAATSTWQIDPNHSAAQFAVRHLAISTVRGAFTKVNGSVQLDDKDISKSSVEVTIDADSVDTRVPNRDKDLRSDHFFDVEKYPTITFKSTKVEQAEPGKLKVTGDLTIHGVTKQAVLDGEGPVGKPKGCGERDDEDQPTGFRREMERQDGWRRVGGR
jgi:polyisoprenoid-binding protein YceI